VGGEEALLVEALVLLLEEAAPLVEITRSSSDSTCRRRISADATSAGPE
jgi:hypothetical protein